MPPRRGVLEALQALPYVVAAHLWQPGVTVDAVVKHLKLSDDTVRRLSSVLTRTARLPPQGAVARSSSTW